MSFQITGFVFLRLKEVKLLDHVVFLFLVFLWTSILFPIVVAPIYIPTIVQDSPSVLPLPTLVFWQQSLWLVWVGISLWLWLAFGDMEHLFMYLSVCTSHLETCLFRSSTHLSIVLFEGFFGVESVIYVFWMLDPHQISFANIFHKIPVLVSFPSHLVSFQYL